MSPLLLFTLNDGRSIIAANTIGLYDGTDRLMAEGSSLVFVSEEKTESFALSAVRECALLTPRDPVPARATVYAFAAVAPAVA